MLLLRRLEGSRLFVSKTLGAPFMKRIRLEMGKQMWIHMRPPVSADEDEDFASSGDSGTTDSYSFDGG